MMLVSKGPYGAEVAFGKCMQHLTVCRPSTILIPPTNEDDLVEAIREEFGLTPLVVARNLWNRDEGEFRLNLI